ncbi:MAG: phage holin family protein [Oscillospiraceae bacterium]|nr:phage holin family protein [Oscillospiraceae bacterium]
MFNNRTSFQFEYLCLTWLFGEFNEAFISLIVLLIMDFTTGVISSFINHNFKGSVFVKGLIKKMFVFVLICAVNIVTVHTLKVGYSIRDYVIYALTGYEFLSIINHIRHFGLRVPKVVDDLLNLFFKET